MRTQMNGTASQGCGCSAAAPLRQTRRAESVCAESGPESKAEPRLEDLVSIAVVIAGGCEPCAERMVARALEQGSSARHVRKVLALIGEMRDQACFRETVGGEVIARMEKPLAAGKRTLENVNPIRAEAAAACRG